MNLVKYRLDKIRDVHDLVKSQTKLQIKSIDYENRHLI